MWWLWFFPILIPLSIVALGCVSVALLWVLGVSWIMSKAGFCVFKAKLADIWWEIRNS